jgi:2-oxoglutarate ferredoxin oxidoreductase subunit beta
MTELNYKKKDFTSDQDVKWCPGCGDYSILASLQMALTKTGTKKEDVVCVSGIGCSSRFPYYMDTYGYHTIHGRAPAVASGIKVANPSLSVWQITGDGDCLSIGGNHFIHVLRRNVDINILLFNNQIYGLTKGQFSPTSEQGKVTKSSPYGSLDRTFNPGKLAFGSGATYICKTLDTDPKHMNLMMQEANKHKGTSFVEVFQNCVIFNDGCHTDYTDRKLRVENAVYLEQGKPMLFGQDDSKGIVLKDLKLEIIDVTEENKDQVLVHDRYNKTLSYLLLASHEIAGFPKFYGVIYQEEAQTYDDQVCAQIEDVRAKKGQGDFNKLLYSGETWEVK